MSEDKSVKEKSGLPEDNEEDFFEGDSQLSDRNRPETGYQSVTSEEKIITSGSDEDDFLPSDMGSDFD